MKISRKHETNQHCQRVKYPIATLNPKEWREELPQHNHMDCQENAYNEFSKHNTRQY